jgi:sugar phosphate isomerase/epimerase
MEEYMKSIITGYFDNDGKSSFSSCVEKTIKLSVDHIALRTYNGQPLIELSDGELKKMLLDLKGERLKISIIDSNILPYDMYDDRKHANVVDEFKYMLKVAERLKVNYLFLRLPIINDVIEEFDTIEKRLGDFVDAAQRASKKIVILPTLGYKTNTYVYIFKKMKSKYLSIAYDPVTIMMSNESATTTYRLLKSYISVFFAHDANQQNEPKLMGFGKTDVIKIMKKLTRDRFSGLIMVDHHFNPAMFKDEEPKKGFFSKIFSNDKKKREKKVSELSKIIFPDEQTKNVTEDDIYENQIKLIQALFK